MSLFDYGVWSVRRLTFLDLRDTSDIYVDFLQSIYNLVYEYVSFSHKKVPLQESLVMPRDLQPIRHSQLVNRCGRGSPELSE